MRFRIPLFPLISMALFAGLCAIVAYWAMILLSPASPIAPAAQPLAARGPADPARIASLFGQPAPANAPAAAQGPINVRILGVMAPSSATRPGGGSANGAGVALVSIDGQPARPYAVGESLPNGLRIQSIFKDRVEFSDQGRILSSPAPAGADPSVLVRGGASAGASAGTSAGASAGVSAPASASVPPGTRPAPVVVPEAPMPPPPPLAPDTNGPGPVPMPAPQ